MSMTLLELKAAFSELQNVIDKITFDEDVSRQLKAQEGKIKTLTDVNELRDEINDYVLNIVTAIAESIQKEFLLNNKITVKTEVLKNKLWEILVNPIAFEYILTTKTINNPLKDIIHELVYSSDLYKVTAVYLYLKSRIRLMCAHINGEKYSDTKEELDELELKLSSTRGINGAITILLGFLGSCKPSTNPNSNHKYHEFVHDEIADILARIATCWPEIINPSNIKKSIKLLANLHAENPGCKKVKLIEQAVVSIATYLAKSSADLNIYNKVLDPKNCYLMTLLTPILFNGQKCNQQIQTHLNSVRNLFESSRIQNCITDISNSLFQIDHKVAIYIILQNAKSYIQERAEVLNVTLNNQIKHFCSLLDTHINGFSLFEIIEEEAVRDDHSAVVSQLRMSKDLTLVEKLGPLYFTYKDYNDYLCSYINGIRTHADGTTRIESNRTNAIITSAHDAIKNKTPIEIVAILNGFIIQLKQKKARMNVTLNNQIDYTISTFEQLIEFTNSIAVKLKPPYEAIYKNLRRIANLLPAKKDTLLLLANQVYFAHDHKQVITDSSFTQTLAEIRLSVNSVQNSGGLESGLFTSPKSNLLNKFEKLNVAIKNVTGAPAVGFSG